MDLGLDGKTALITGGSKGIGRAIAEDLAVEGANLVLVARGSEALEETKQRLEAKGASVLAIAGDATVADTVNGAVQAAQKRFGSIDIAVANVYPLHRYGFGQARDEDFRTAFETMFLSTVYLARATLPGMQERGWGRIVNIGSFCMREAHRDPKLVLSNTFRLAVAGFNKSLADEFAPDGITVNTIATGYILTERLKQSRRQHAGATDVAWEQLEKERAAHIPMGRTGHPEEMAALCTFLCSARASYITGQVMSVDGGLVAAY